MQKELSKAKTEKEFEKAMRQFLSPSEIIMIEKRLAILELLDQGIKYSDIKEIIDVSGTTISFVRKGFKNNPKKQRLIKKEPPKILKLPDMGYPTYKGRGRWRYLNR